MLNSSLELSQRGDANFPVETFSIAQLLEDLREALLDFTTLDDLSGWLGRSSK
jgi:hypothetical protein